jgi:3-deoxy-D-manno-octulosonic-acid transferase
MAAIWIESELWPNMLTVMKQRKIPVALLNARMSDKSFRYWHVAKGWAQELMSGIVLCLAQSTEDAAHFVALGAPSVKALGNIKYAAASLPYNAEDLEKLRRQIERRPLWLIASTHKGEEDIALQTHRELALTHPTILTVIVPRHAARGDEVADMLHKERLDFARRSKNEVLRKDTQIYLADTMGELGLFYALSPIAVIGGSFVPIGGHNPIEPAQAGAAIIMGPHMYKAAKLVDDFLSAQAAVQLQSAKELSGAVDHLIKHSSQRDMQVQAARLLVEQKRHILDEIIDELKPIFVA